MSAQPPSSDEMKRWLAAVAREQDRGAFGCLFQFFAPRIASFMLRNGLNPGEAEDMAQETMVTVWRKAALYDPRQASVSTWVFTIARNLRIDRARKDARTKAGVAALGYEAPETEASSAEDETLASERDARVRRAMEGLSPAQATVLKLSFFSDKPHAQIARELNIPLGTVKSRARLAMAKIRALLEQDT